MTTQTVLIIDDDRAIHEQVSVVLSKAGYRVISAFSGKEGLQLAVKENPSLIVLDHRMPGMDGVETYRRLRKQPSQAASLPVVMLTAANHSNKRIREIINSGVSAYLEKPFGGKELLNVLRNIIMTHDLARDRASRTSRERSSAFLLNLVETCPLMIVTTDLHGNITFANQLACQFMGRAPDDMTGQPVKSFIPDHDSLFTRLLRSERGGPISEECRVRANGDTWRSVGVHYGLLTDEIGTQEGLLIVCQDLAAQKAHEKRIEQKARCNAISESLATINHQINNPLTPILGNVQLMRRGRARLAKDDQEKLEIIENNALRISNIIRSFNEAATSPSKPYYGDITMLDI